MSRKIICRFHLNFNFCNVSYTVRFKSLWPALYFNSSFVISHHFICHSVQKSTENFTISEMVGYVGEGPCQTQLQRSSKPVLCWWHSTRTFYHTVSKTSLPWYSKSHPRCLGVFQAGAPWSVKQLWIVPANTATDNWTNPKSPSLQGHSCIRVVVCQSNDHPFTQNHYDLHSVPTVAVWKFAMTNCEV